MAQSASRLRADFDRIARFEDEGWNHNSHYHPFLLRHLPARLHATLDVGCGTGGFSRLLAKRSDRVLALDLSPRMIELAKARSKGSANIDFEVVDIRERDLPSDHFDCIASIATLHHLPWAEILPRLKDALRPGGTLLILDLYLAEGFWQKGTAAAAFPVNLLLRTWHRGKLWPTREARAAWDAHGKTDVYPTTREIRMHADNFLPQAKLTRHFLWRYSLVWKKPSA